MTNYWYKQINKTPKHLQYIWTRESHALSKLNEVYGIVWVEPKDGQMKGKLGNLTVHYIYDKRRYEYRYLRVLSTWRIHWRLLMPDDSGKLSRMCDDVREIWIRMLNTWMDDTPSEFNTKAAKIIIANM